MDKNPSCALSEGRGPLRMQVLALRLRRPMLRLLTACAGALALCLTMVPLVQAGGLQSLPGQVQRVVNGDTLVVDAQGYQHRVRLAGIRAPQHSERWAADAARELRMRLAGRHVLVRWYGRDMRRSLLGVVTVGREDANLEMLSRGLARFDEASAAGLAPGLQESYRAAEQTARRAHRGLWSDPDPIPPAWRGSDP